MTERLVATDCGHSDKMPHQRNVEANNIYTDGLYFLTACTPPYELEAQILSVDEVSMKLYYFAGENDFWAATIDETGANLPNEHGPWKFQKSVPLSDHKINGGGMDERVWKEIQARGFSLAEIAVTFEPGTITSEET